MRVLLSLGFQSRVISSLAGLDFDLSDPLSVVLGDPAEIHSHPDLRVVGASLCRCRAGASNGTRRQDRVHALR